MQFTRRQFIKDIGIIAGCLAAGIIPAAGSSYQKQPAQGNVRGISYTPECPKHIPVSTSQSLTYVSNDDLQKFRSLITSAPTPGVQMSPTQELDFSHPTTKALYHTTSELEALENKLNAHSRILGGFDISRLTNDSQAALEQWLNKFSPEMQEEILEQPNSPLRMINTPFYLFCDSDDPVFALLAYRMASQDYGLRSTFLDNSPDKIEFPRELDLASAIGDSIDWLVGARTRDAAGMKTPQYARNLSPEQRKQYILETGGGSNNANPPEVVTFMWYGHSDFGKEMIRERGNLQGRYKPSQFLSDDFLNALGAKHINVILATCAGHLPEDLAKRLDEHNNKEGQKITYTILYSQYSPSTPKIGTRARALPEMLTVAQHPYKASSKYANTDFGLHSPVSYSDLMDLVNGKVDLDAFIECMYVKGSSLAVSFNPYFYRQGSLEQVGQRVVFVNLKPESPENSALYPRLLISPLLNAASQEVMPTLGMGLKFR